MKKTYITLFAVAFAFASCKPNLSPEPASSGEADFTKYVSIGNSLTAGYADNSLYRSGQVHSFPAILAEQFSYAGGGDFLQPLLPGEAGWPSPKLVLGLKEDCKGVSSLSPLPYSGNFDTTGSGTLIVNEGPFNNLGVPGIRAIDLAYPMALYGALNPYAGRMFGNTAKNYIDFAAESDPTFFTIWIGNNDVLGYATNGGEGAVGGVQRTDISPIANFKENYEKLIRAMTEGKKAKGVLITIPDITSIPFFNVIDRRGLILDATQAAQLTQAYAPLGITFSEGNNYFIIEDPLAPGGRRKIRDGEYLIMTTPSDSIKCAGWGSLTPIPAKYVLDETEVGNVAQATKDFNNIIKFQAEEHGLAVFDAFEYLRQFKSGMFWDGVNYSATFVTGGLFSLDGVHLNSRGYAMVANQIIRTINQHYKSTIPLAEVNKYPGVKFP